MTQALVFAAGLGTRLKPLTDRVPKALVDVGGVPMLERVIRRLAAAGVDRVVVNVHAFAARIERFVCEHAHAFGAEAGLSHAATRPLDTGGGLLHAREHLRPDEPIVLHNADVLTDLSLDALLAAHARHDALATLAVMERPTQRFLLFDDAGLLGRVDETKGLERRVREPAGAVRRLAFAGVHVVAPDLLTRITERGAFSILEPYLRLAAEGATLRPFRADGSLWIDIGRPAQLEEARRLVREADRTPRL